MISLLAVWIQFAVCVLLVGAAGVRLIRYGDALAGLAGMSRSWVGLVLVATVTSLPELVTGLSAVTIAAAPDIAAGDALGSCVFNLAILAILDVFYRKDSIYAIAGAGHILSAAFGVILLAAVALVLLLSAMDILPQFGHVSTGSLAIVGLYAWAIRTIYLAERRQRIQPEYDHPEISLKVALVGYFAAAVVIIVAGIWLPLLGVELARIMGWSNSFVGTLFVALATSVPELATTLGALRAGAIDMAIGNLLGSNLFDVLILAIDDVAYVTGSLYTEVSSLHLLSALSACLMSGAVVAALAYRPASRVWRTGSWVSIALLAVYLLNALIQFVHNR